MCDNKSGGTFEIPEHVYPYRVWYGSSSYAGTGDVEITEEQYDGSSSSSQINVHTYGNMNVKLYKVDDTHFTVTAANIWTLVVLGKSRS